MDLQLDPEQLQLRDASRRLLTQRMTALVEQLPSPPVHDTDQALRDAQALGWLGLGLPEKVGGAGGFEDLTLVHEELGRGLAPSLTMTLGIAARLVLRGAPSRVDLLERLCSGELLVAPAIDLFAHQRGFSVTHGAVSGTQRHVVDARAVSHLLVAAEEHLVLVDAADATLTDESNECDIACCTVTLDVAEGEVLSSDASEVLRVVRAEATILAAARALGGGRAVLERAVDHVKTRHQFDRPIGTFQAVQHQLADVATTLDAAGLALARAAWSVESAADQADIDAAAAIAGLAAGDAFSHATVVAHQLHGGMGFVLDSPLHLWSARAVADPTAPRGRRHLLDRLAAVSG